MKKKYFSPTINVYNIVEAETILAGSKHEFTFITDVTPFVYPRRGVGWGDLHGIRYVNISPTITSLRN